MMNVPVVQGVAMPANGKEEPLTYTPDFGGVKGEPQPKMFQDVGFAVGFVAHLCVMLFFLLGAVRASDGQQNGSVASGIVYVVMTTAIFALGLSTFALGFMMQFATQLIKMALFFSIGCSLAIGVLGAMSGQMLMAVMGFISSAFGCCYAYFVWGRIPFAAINLNTALTGVKANLGLAVVAYLFLFIAIGWSVWWSVAAGGAMNSMGNGAIFLFLVSYYWTHQVIQNTLRVTTAGVIGTWWHAPDEASSCCGPAIKDSVIRATTYSFGSICFGSLLVAIVQALRHLQRMIQDNQEFNFLLCIVDCILGCIESILEYLNKWAYVYVGLYGYSYLDAGRNVITLFQNKGWTAIITDDLIENVLLMMSVVIGLISGMIGLILVSMDQNLLAALNVDNYKMAGFLIGFLVGFVLSSILMSVVGSAVNTVIVCFAEAPREFQTNHPKLSNEMRAAWRQAWPVECGNI